MDSHLIFCCTLLALDLENYFERSTEDLTENFCTLKHGRKSFYFNFPQGFRSTHLECAIAFPNDFIESLLTSSLAHFAEA